MAILTNCIYLDILLIFSSLLATLYLWMKWKHSYWQRRGIRSLPTHWFFGHFKDAILMRKPPGVILGELYQQGNDEDDVLGIYILFKPFLLVRNSELIKQIMIKDFNVFPNHHFVARSNADKMSGYNLFGIGNPEWKYLRTKMSPVFTSGKLKSLFLLMVESGELMGAHLRSQISNDSKFKSISIKDVFYKYTTNIVASLAFGIQTNCFDTPNPEFYVKSREAFNLTFVRAIKFFFLFFLPNIGKHLRNKMLGDSTEYFRKVFWESMDNRTITKMKRGDLIDSLLQLKNEQPDSINFHMMQKQEFEKFNRNSNNKDSVWFYFLRGKTNKNECKCTTCDKIIHCAGGSTSGMHTHLKAIYNKSLLKRSTTLLNESAASTSSCSSYTLSKKSNISSKNRLITHYFPNETDNSLPAVLARLTSRDGLSFRTICTSLDIRLGLTSRGFSDIPKSRLWPLSNLLSKHCVLEKLICIKQISCWSLCLMSYLSKKVFLAKNLKQLY
nr:PREDICTED: cytochrome P450 6k1-like isoform X4 [Linepithema humile]